MKKWIILVLGLAVVAGAVFATPKIVEKCRAAAYEKALINEYETFISNNKTFYKESYLNGLDISGLTVEQAKETVINDFMSRHISVTAPSFNGEADIPFSCFSINMLKLDMYLDEAYNNQTLSMDEYYVQANRKDYSYDLTADVDINGSDFSDFALFKEENVTKSEDAYVVVDSLNKKVVVVPEVYGTEIDRDRFTDLVSEAVFEGKTSIELTKEDFISPKVLSDDPSLKERCEYINTLFNKSLSIDACGVNAVLLPEETFAFYDFDSESLIDEEKLGLYVDSLKESYDTWGTSRTFMTSLGYTVEITPGGDYGWLIDKEQTVEALKDMLLSDIQEESISVVCTVIGQRPADDEISNTYVEVSLENQKIWMYVGGECIVFDDVTTGEASDPACISRTGMFRLKNKKTDCILRGPTWEDFVHYWMSFDGDNGMHDAMWRTDEEFGGTNRFGNGSHGCTNLRLPTAEIVFNNIDYSIPIIVW